MKNIATNLMTSAVLLATLGGTIGTTLEAQSLQMHAVVPFAWQLNDRQMEAGDYMILKDPSSSVITIRDMQNGTGTYVLGNSGLETATVTRLVFHCYGSHRFLAEIVAPGLVFGKLPVSRAEKTIRSDQPHEMATVFVDVKPLVN